LSTLDEFGSIVPYDCFLMRFRSVADFFVGLNKNAQRFPASVAFVSRSGHITYRYLAGCIESVAAGAAAAGIGPKQTILLNCSNNEARYPLIFGLLRLGVTLALGVSPKSFLEHNVRFDAMVTDNPQQQGNFKIVRPTAQWFSVQSKGKAVSAGSRDYAVIFSSSGSTGTPKKIKFSKENIEYLIKSKFRDIYYPEFTRSFLAAGTDSIPILVDIIITLLKAGVVIQHTERSPEGILDNIDIFRPNYVSLAPSALVRILELLRENPRNFDKIDYLRLTGDYCSIGTREKALGAFAKDIVTSYGATEIGRVAWGRLADIRYTEGSVGRIIAGMKIESVDGDGNPLPGGSEGEIRIRPPNAAVATYVTPLGYQSPLRDGWFYPGDIGRVDSTGNLIITGRKSAVINLGGNKVSPEYAESLLGKMDAIEDVGVSAVKGSDGFDLVCAVIVKKKGLSLDDINAHLQRQRAHFPVSKVRFVSAIPRTENGKVDRVALKEIAN
jgi:long-chain acyl-CoA synthetase